MRLALIFLAVEGSRCGDVSHFTSLPLPFHSFVLSLTFTKVGTIRSMPGSDLKSSSSPGSFQLFAIVTAVTTTAFTGPVERLVSSVLDHRPLGLVKRCHIAVGDACNEG